MSWDPRSISSQAGKTFVVTDANAGLGYFTSAQLAGAGAQVVLACRNPARADAATALLDLPRIDGLILNAGTVHPPKNRELSAGGHELVFATNYLGHCELAARVLGIAERLWSRSESLVGAPFPV